MGNEQSLTHRHVTDKKMYEHLRVILGIQVTSWPILWVNKVKLQYNKRVNKVNIEWYSITILSDKIIVVVAYSR